MALSGTPVSITHKQKVKEGDIVRPLAKFPPSPWGPFFIDYAQDARKLEKWNQRAQLLKEEVKKIMRDARGKQDEISLVDVLKRVGLEYPFQTEIEDALYRIYQAYLTTADYNDDEDLHHVAFKFRVLREGGYKISSDVFQRFKDEKGEFKQSLISNVEGLLSLHEAAFLGTQGEDILDKAIAFTTKHLKAVLPTLHALLANQVERALNVASHRRLPRVNARYFVTLYDQRETDNFDGTKTVIEFAKLYYNLVQATHQTEIKAVSKWWKERQLAEKFSYARDRVVECYNWNMNVATDEPNISRTRIFAAKMLSLISVTDDTYDAYGVYEELVKYTQAIDRWDLGAMDDLPEYMKTLYFEIFSILKEMEEGLEKEGLSYQIGYLKKGYQDMCRNYLKEAEWYHNRYTPGTEEYFRVSSGSSGYLMLFILNILGMKEATREVIEWSMKRPRIIVASTEICRFMDDLVGHKFEQERGHSVSAVECFIKEKGMTEEEVYALFKQIYNNAWKDINEACLHPRVFPMYILSKPLNLCRVIESWYTDGGKDGYTFSGGHTKEMIASLLVNPIPI